LIASTKGIANAGAVWMRVFAGVLGCALMLVGAAAEADGLPPVTKVATGQADFVVPDGPEFKLPLTVLIAYDAEERECDALRIGLESALVDTGRFQVVDRQALPGEMGLSAEVLSASLAHPGRVLTLGRWTPTQAFIVLFEHARETGHSLEARVFSTESGSMVDRIEAPLATPGDATARNDAAEELARSINSLFPRIAGRVLVASTSGVALSYTAADGVRPGMQALIFREGDDAVVKNGEMVLRGTPQLVARVRIMQVAVDATRAQVLHLEEGSEILEDMFVITR